MKKDKTHLSIRMEQQLHDKFQYIAAYEGRSMSGQILHLIQILIRDCVAAFEKEHGPIEEQEK